MTDKFRYEGIDIPRDTVCRKFKQIGNASKISVEDGELSLQKQKVRLKCFKNIKIKTTETTYFLKKKNLKKGNKKKEKRKWIKKEEKIIK